MIPTTEEAQRHKEELVELSRAIPAPIGIWWWKKCPKCKGKLIEKQCEATVLSTYHFSYGRRKTISFAYLKCGNCDYEYSKLLYGADEFLLLSNPLAQEIETKRKEVAEKKRLQEEAIKAVCAQMGHNGVLVKEKYVSSVGFEEHCYYSTEEVLRCSRCGKRLSP